MNPSVFSSSLLVYTVYFLLMLLQDFCTFCLCLCIYFCDIVYLLLKFNIIIFGCSYFVYFSSFLTGITLIIIHQMSLFILFFFLLLLLFL